MDQAQGRFRVVAEPSLRFVVEGPPVGLERPRLGGGHVYTPTKSRDYKQRVTAACFRANGFKRLEAVCVLVRCFFKNGAHPDGDNVLKLVLDALVTGHTAMKDDRNIDSAVEHYYDAARPRLEVELWTA